MQLRLAARDDLAEVKALVDAAYTPWIDVIGAIPGPMKDDYAHAIAQGIVQLLEGSDGIEALLVLIAMPEVMLLDSVAVHPSAQGKGHGRRLMKAAESAARCDGYRRIRLYTHEKMARNIGIYQRQGCEITHRVTEQGLNRVYMEKRLCQSDPEEALGF